MDETSKPWAFSSFERGGFNPSPKSSALFPAGNWSMEQPIVFGQAAIGNRSAGAGGAVRKGRDRPRSLSPAGGTARQFVPQQASKGNTKSAIQQSEEEAAKARRLVRFSAGFDGKTKTLRPSQKAETVEKAVSKSSVESLAGTSELGNRVQSTGSAKRRETTPVRRPEAAEEPVEMDGIDMLISEAILGVCPDMCPEIEREERQRKGDLDRFERLEGDRNQTSIDLAVKKYTRTAEKDAALIRPLPVLQSTMNHLLSLLERDHEDDLLAVHNFLWDRMRAVRMDLRMQHIFSEDAITMHEQMIRFHILAMHELCEYAQGEQVSEGFNAHLNIEQMNKTSVDLFQMYDDHWKQGIPVPSEAEFRGYYALLKLDKHPGYRVEPAELSLDLAKMAPEIRRSPQVLFARDVARACRGSNYVAFFRLAKQATYLQACLMHAHFSKLRTQALASLHSGLLKNQGIPLSAVVDWLGMEGEDIEALIKYHGFSVKFYEEPYMVKEGSFLNKDQDFPTCRAQMVEEKRSLLIVADVQSGRLPSSLANNVSIMRRIESMRRNETIERRVVPAPMKLVEEPTFDGTSTFVDMVEEYMPDYVEEDEQLPKYEEPGLSPVILVPEVFNTPAEDVGKQGKKRRMEGPEFEVEEHERRRLRHELDASARREASQAAVAEIKRQEEKLRGALHKAEADAGKQLHWLRKWRRRAASKSLEKRRRLEKAEAALNSLSLGYPLWKKQVRKGDSLSLAERHAYLKDVVTEQGGKLQELWAPVIISDLVLPILHELNVSTRFLCWSLLVSTAGTAAGNWIRMKLSSKRMSKIEERFLDYAQADAILADEKKIFQADEDSRPVAFWYTATEVGHGRSSLPSKGAEHGAGGLICVVDGGESVATDQARLHSLVQALPDGASVPLLVLSAKRWCSNGSEKVEVQKSWERFLKSDELTSSKISVHTVMSIGNHSEVIPGELSFFSDQSLKEGLLWLAKNCPLQPQLRPLYAGDLVREHLEAHMKLLLRVPLSKISPEQCIMVFNGAVEKAAEEIEKTAHSVPPNWPPDFGVVREALEAEAQNLVPLQEGWNAKRTLEINFAALQSCLLPTFPLTCMLNPGNGIILQRLKLEETLLEYLAMIEGTTVDNPTTRWEVNQMLQKGCTVEWSNTGRKLVPKWAHIFQVIFTARLLLLNEKASTCMYISRVDKQPPLQLYEFEKCIPFYQQIVENPDSYYDGEPTLDELIGEESLKNDLVEREAFSQSQQVPNSGVPNVSFKYSSTTSMFKEDPQDNRLAQDWISVTKEGNQLGARHEMMEPPQKQDLQLGLRWQEGSGSLCSLDKDDPSTPMEMPLTDSELLLDKMMTELDVWRSRSSNKELETASFQHNSSSVFLPYTSCWAELSGNSHQDYLKQEFGGRSLHLADTFPLYKEGVAEGNIQVDLTECEVLLDSRIAEFGTGTPVKILL